MLLRLGTLTLGLKPNLGGSGDARAEVGVRLVVLTFLAAGLGEGWVSRGKSGKRGAGISSCGDGGPLGIPLGIGGTCIIESRLSRRVSVGLIVLAPRPLALPEAAIDWRLLPDEDGVVERMSLFTLLFPGDRPPAGVFGSGSRGGGCRLLTLAWREAVVAVKVEVRGSSAPAEALGWIVVRLALFRLLDRANEALVGSAAVLVGC